MRRVIFNQKGGVGKSSITCNLAAISAQRGHKTLVVDMDVQGNASYYLGDQSHKHRHHEQHATNGSYKHNQGCTVAELLNQNTGFFSVPKKPIEFVRESPFENLYLIPSSPELDLIEKELESRYKMFKLRDALRDISDQFEHIYIDTPPNFNFYSKSALIAGDRVLVPFDCDSFSRHAIYNLMGNIAELQQDHNPHLRIEGVVVNQFNSQANFPKALINELLEENLPVLPAYLPASVKMKESHSAQCPLPFFAPNHKLTQQFYALYDELEARDSKAGGSHRTTEEYIIDSLA